MSEASGAAQTSLSQGKIIAYSLPSIPMAAVGLPLLVHIPPFYVSQMGLSLELVGFLFMIARFWDVFTDPVLGILSDRFETRWGRRRHWMVASVPVLMISVYMLFWPPQGVSGLYMAFWLFALYAGWTLLTISHSSWGAELTSDYHERNKVQGIREIAGVTGVIIVLVLPIFIDFFVEEDIEAKRIQIMGMFMMVLLPIAIWIAVTRVGERPTPRPSHITFRTAMEALVKNKSLRIILAADILLGISFGMHSGTFLFLCVHVLHLGNMSGIFLLCYVGSGIAFIPIVLKISLRWDKHKTASNLMLFGAASVVPILLLPPGNVPLAMICFIIFGITSSSSSFIFRSMVADVADQDAVETGQQRTGLFYSVVSMTSKVGGAIAIWISYTLLAIIGFDPTGANTPEALTGLRFIYAGPTVISCGLAFLFFRFYTLTEEVQVRNRGILEDRVVHAMAEGLEDLTHEPADTQSPQSGET